MTTCVICGDELPNVAHEYGDCVNGPVVCFNDWMIYLDWQQQVTAVAETVFAEFTQRGGDEVAAQVLTLAGYLTFVAPDDVEADVLDEYDLLPAHVPAGGGRMSAQMVDEPAVRSRGRPWTAAEEAVLRASYHETTAFDVGRRVRRSAEAVRQKAMALGLSHPAAARIRWTPEANALMRERYHRGDAPTLALQLGTTVDAVRKQAQTLGLARPTPHQPWTPERDRVLRELYGLVDAGVLAARLGYSRAAVYNRLKSLGVTRATAQAARYARDQAEIRRLREHGSDDGDGRRASILIAYRMSAIGAAEAAVALGVPVTRLAVELGKAAARGQAAVAAALGEREG